MTENFTHFSNNFHASGRKSLIVHALLMALLTTLFTTVFTPQLQYIPTLARGPPNASNHAKQSWAQLFMKGHASERLQVERKAHKTPSQHKMSYPIGKKLLRAPQHNG